MRKETNCYACRYWNSEAKCMNGYQENELQTLMKNLNIKGFFSLMKRKKNQRWNRKIGCQQLNHGMFRTQPTVQFWEQIYGMFRSQWSRFGSRTIGCAGVNIVQAWVLKTEVFCEPRTNENSWLTSSQFWYQHLLECVENAVPIWDGRRPWWQCALKLNKRQCHLLVHSSC